MQGHYLKHNLDNEEVYTIHNIIIPKVNLPAWQEFEPNLIRDCSAVF